MRYFKCTFIKQTVNNPTNSYKQAQVTNLKLLDLDGNIVSEGSGKGEHHKIGALAESIEHYFLDKEQNSDLLKLRNLIANINLFNDA